METPTGPRGNRVLVLLVLPFYLAWSALRSLSSALIAAADRAAEIIARALRAIGDLLRPVVARLMTLAHAVGRIMIRIGRALALLARIVLRVLDATVGRLVRAVLDGLGRFGVALARAIALVIRWIWDPSSPIRIAIVAIASAARRFVIAVVRLAATAATAIGRLVGPPLAGAVAGARRLLQGLARAAGTVVAAIRSIVGPVLAKAVVGARAVLRVLARTVARVAAPVTVAARRLAADLRRAVSPLHAAIASAVREARRSVRQMLGLAEAHPPDQLNRARNPQVGVPARPSAASIDQPASSRHSSAGSIAATTTVLLLPLVIGYDLLALSDATVAIAIVLGVGFLVGLAHFRARGRDAVFGFGLGTAAVTAFQAITAPLLHATVTGSPIAGWLVSTVIGLSTVYAGFLVGDVTAPRAPHPH